MHERVGGKRVAGGQEAATWADGWRLSGRAGGTAAECVGGDGPRARGCHTGNRVVGQAGMQTHRRVRRLALAHDG